MSGYIISGKKRKESKLGEYMDNAKLLHDYLVGKGNKMKDKIIYTKSLEKDRIWRHFIAILYK